MGEKLLSWIRILISPLLNEQGEINLESTDTEDDGELGSQDQDTDTDEGEVEDKDLEDQDTAETDQALIDSEGTDTPANVPYARFKEVNDKAKQAELNQQKFDQLKALGREAYYKLYPDEKPNDFDSSADKTDGEIDIRSQKISGGKYDGLTFGEVFDRDEEAAFDIKPYYAQRLREEKLENQRKAQSEQEKLERETDEEISTFRSNISKAKFGKEKDLNEKESAEVQKVIDETVEWMGQQSEKGRYINNINDAYLLKNYNSFMTDKADQTLKTVVDSLKDDGVSSISSAKTTTKEAGFGRFLNMSNDQARDTLYAMDSKEKEEFYKKAPEAVRKKFPNLPWPGDEK